MKRLALLILAFPCYANEPPYLPLAVCENGLCTMKQADYEAFQKFHVEVGRRYDQMATMLQQSEREVQDLSAKLNRVPYCQFKTI